MTMRKIFAFTLALCFLAALGSVSPASAAQSPYTGKPPKPTLRADRTEITAGESVTFTFFYDKSLSVTGKIYYGNAYDQLFSASSSKPPTGSGTYTYKYDTAGTRKVFMTVWNPQGSTDSDSITITVKSKPSTLQPLSKPTLSASKTTAYVGEPVTITLNWSEPVKTFQLVASRVDIMAGDVISFYPNGKSYTIKFPKKGDWQISANLTTTKDRKSYAGLDNNKLIIKVR